MAFEQPAEPFFPSAFPLCSSTANIFTVLLKNVNFMLKDFSLETKSEMRRRKNSSRKRKSISCVWPFHDVIFLHASESLPTTENCFSLCLLFCQIRRPRCLVSLLTHNEREPSHSMFYLQYLLPHFYNPEKRRKAGERKLTTNPSLPLPTT